MSSPNPVPATFHLSFNSHSSGIFCSTKALQATLPTYGYNLKHLNDKKRLFSELLQQPPLSPQAAIKLLRPHPQALTPHLECLHPELQTRICHTLGAGAEQGTQVQEGHHRHTEGQAQRAEAHGQL
eukprot:scaffold241964_cov24-Tisochrysis_lutea.AAC.1